MKSRPEPVDAQEIRRWIRGCGKRATPGRIAVVQALREAARPMTHADLAVLLEPRGFDRASLFRNLADLTDAGLIARTDLGDHVWRFHIGHHVGQPGDRRGPHPHFVCVACGKALCLDGVELTVRSSGETPRALREQQAEINIRGRCDDCYEPRGR